MLCELRLDFSDDLVQRFDMQAVVVYYNNDSIAFGDVILLTQVSGKDDAS